MRTAAVQQALLQSARCVSAAALTTAQVGPAASCVPHKVQHPGSHVSVPPSAAAGPSSQALAALAQWSSRRGFLSSLMQPESKVYRERRLIGYSPEQLYDVVSDVQHYSKFVPWCVGSHILRRDQDGRYLEAELQIGFQMISEKYTSRVSLHPPHRVSSTVADSGLFHHLESSWSMAPGPSPNTTWLSFNVDFAFCNPLYANVAQLFFSEVVARMMGAFEGRCRHLYGQPSPAAPGPRGHTTHHVQHHATAAVTASAAGAPRVGGGHHQHLQQHQQHLQHQQHQRLQAPPEHSTAAAAGGAHVGGAATATAPAAQPAAAALPGDAQ